MLNGNNITDIFCIIFVTLSFFFWPLYCLFFFDLHPPITPLYQFKLLSKQNRYEGNLVVYVVVDIQAQKDGYYRQIHKTLNCLVKGNHLYHEA
jgi:hypothetical protein